MSEINLADSEGRLDELVDRVQAGDTVTIIREGRSVARLVSAVHKRQRVDLEALRALTATIPPQSDDAAALMRVVRDADRY